MATHIGPAIRFAAAMAALTSVSCAGSGAEPRGALNMNEEAMLVTWPHAARTQLAAVVTRFAHTKPGAYAVFDADETIWRHDLEEALLPYVEAQGRIRLDTLSPSLLPVALHPGESLTSYYRRLCNIDESVGFLWLGEAFAGLSLAELRDAVRAMMASRAPLRTTLSTEDGQHPIEIRVPEIYQQQVELIHTLEAHGIRVYVVTACLEELARMVLCDPAFGIGLPPQNVVGLRMLLRRPDGSVVAGWPGPEPPEAIDARAWQSEERLELRLTPFLAAIPTWYAGKVAAIKSRIDPALRPVLVAGDSRSDFYMLMYSAVAEGGARLFVRRDEEHWQELQSAIALRSGASDAAWHADEGAALGWIPVDSTELATLPPLAR